MSADRPGRALYGVMAEFDDSARAGRRRSRACEAEGYTKIDAYTPYPIEEVLGGARAPQVAGAAHRAHRRHPRRRSSGFFLQYWVSAIEYPLNVGGRPFNSGRPSSPSPSSARSSVAVLAAVAACFILNGLPEPYHPVFNVPRFAFASRDRYFLCIEATDPSSTATRTRLLLTSRLKAYGGHRCRAFERRPWRSTSPVWRCLSHSWVAMAGCRNEMYDQAEVQAAGGERVLHRTGRSRAAALERYGGARVLARRQGDVRAGSDRTASS